MISQRRSPDAIRLGYTKFKSSTKKGESSKSREQKSTKPKNKNHACYHCGKPCHIENVFKRKNGKSNSKPKFNAYCFIVISMDIRKMSIDQRHQLHLDLKVIAIIVGYSC